VPVQTSQPIIIVRKKKGHGGGHHGGAWKVAYADFVTAMLALFIVLWLSSSSEQVKKAVGGYFVDPTGKGKDVGNGLKGVGSESLSIRKDDMSTIREVLQQAIKNSTSLQKIKEHVVFTVTGEGLRVELLEGENSTFFESANSHPTELGKDLLKKLAEEIGKLPNRVTMEGHTDSRPYAGGTDYSNWELSSDRANAARRWMRQNGLRDDQVTQVRGFADQSLRDPAHPDDGANRRVTLVIMYQASNPPDPSPAAPPVAAGRSSAPAARGGAVATPAAAVKPSPVAVTQGRAAPGKAPPSSPPKH
jgi:chemotaxis protein MotB